MLRHAYTKTSPVHCACLVGMDSAQRPSHGHDTVGNWHIPQRFPLYILRTIWKCLAEFCGTLRVTAHNANLHIDGWSFNLVLASQSAYGHRAGIAGYVRRTRWRIRLWLSGIFLAHYGHCLSRWFSAALRLAQTCRVSFSTASLTEARPSASHHSFFPFAAASPALLSRLHPRRCAA